MCCSGCVHAFGCCDHVARVCVWMRVRACVCVCARVFVPMYCYGVANTITEVIHATSLLSESPLLSCLDVAELVTVCVMHARLGGASCV